jgi:hypothetical protein
LRDAPQSALLYRTSYGAVILRPTRLRSIVAGKEQNSLVVT